MVERIDIANEADKWINVRWRHQGRTVIHGIDCIGVLVQTCLALGMAPGYVDNRNYSRTASKESLIVPFRENMTEKERNTFNLGDVVLFKDDIFPCHVGIITQMEPRVRFTHAYVMLKKVVKQDLSPDWESRITHCFEFKEVA